MQQITSRKRQWTKLVHLCYQRCLDNDICTTNGLSGNKSFWIPLAELISHVAFLSFCQRFVQYRTIVSCATMKIEGLPTAKAVKANASVLIVQAFALQSLQRRSFVSLLWRRSVEGNLPSIQTRKSCCGRRKGLQFTDNSQVQIRLASLTPNDVWPVIYGCCIIGSNALV